MPETEITELAKAGKYSDFEARCLELLEQGRLQLAQLKAPFATLERTGQAEKLATLTQMVFDMIDPAQDPKAALGLVRTALVASPENRELRTLAVTLYRAAYGDTPGFDLILQASGLEGGRPVRMAIKLLDLCLTLQPGDTLISRMDDHVVEVTDIDRANGLFMLRQSGRVTTRPAPEVVREYDRVASDDFRVLRQLRPDKLPDIIANDPVALVVGLIHAHGGLLDSDRLKHELVPRYIPAKDWASWWNKARTKLKRDPHVVVEGRSPLILSYSAEARTLEDETWEALEAQRSLAEWTTTIERYVREKASQGEPADEGLLRRFHDYLLRYIEATRRHRPAEALECALALERLEAKGVALTDASRGLAGQMLREAEDAFALLQRIESDALRERGLEALRAARPEVWADAAVAWLETAPANLLDTLVEGALRAGRRDAVQSFIDRGLNDFPHHAELVYWLWKGSKHAGEFNLPSEDELFRMILDNLVALGRTVAAEPDVVKTFRQRMKAALSLRSYDRARRVLQRTSEAAAITIRRELQRLEGLGANTPAALLDALRDTHPQLWVTKTKRIEPWEDAETVWCTAKGLERRVAERDELVNVKMHQNAKRIGEAASHGDLSENSEYKFALEERDFLRAQLAKMNDELSRARVLEPAEVPEDYVGIGSRVTLRGPDGATQEVTFLGPFETDVERGVYSYQAPLSQRVMGHRLGERVTLTLDGQDVEYEITALANGLAGR